MLSCSQRWKHGSRYKVALIAVCLKTGSQREILCVFCYEVIFLRQYSFCVNDEVQIFSRGKLSLEIAGLTHVPSELFCGSSDGSKQKLLRKVEILFQAKFLRKFGIESVGMCRWIFALLLHNNVCPSIWLLFFLLECHFVSFICNFLF